MAILHTEFTEEKIEESKISQTDRATNAYIEKYGNIIFDPIISEEREWQIFYNLSELRTGILSWYDFTPGARALEIGAGFGALTGCLCRKCAHVTATERSLYRARAIAKRYEGVDNLDVYAGDISCMEFQELFDYIVVIGLLERIGRGSRSKEPYAAYLERLQNFLKPQGRILLAVENRFGLRYFCGAVEPHTNRAFDGLNGYRQGTGGYSFSRQEMEEVVSEAGFDYHKFYYPLPDYKLPQLIYTDAYLPERNLKERLLPYYRRSDTLVMSEQELYDDIISNHVFPFFANSFLVECGRCGRNTGEGIVYAAVSTDRGEERGFATAIYGNGLVRKEPLYEKGQENARKLYGNILDLQAHGIPVVEHRLVQDDVLELPFISWPTLSNYIKEIMGRDTEEFLALVDRIYAYILQSSEEAAEGENALAARRLKKEADVQEQEGGSCPDFGPILKKAYMELIPLNCFYHPQTGEFLYFDQEFVRENYPAKYVLFRAIHYIYCFTPNAEQYYPKQKLLQKYQMEDTWEIYLQEELRFLDEVRNREQYRRFYQWTQIDYGRMRENAKRLESQEERVADYHISHKMKLIWKTELAMLEEVDKICKKHNLTYFLLHGSLLGAVRHKGFIPWDDDLDIGMLRADYDRFLEAAEKELPKPLSLCTPQSEQDVFWGGFVRIRNGETTGMEARDLGHQGNLGIWIDILPLDVCTADERKFEVKQRKLVHCQRLLYAKVYGKNEQIQLGLNFVQRQGYGLLSKFYSHDRLCRLLDRRMRMYTEEASEDVAVFSGYGKFRRLYGKDFADTVLLEFEGRKVPAPVGYENYLFMTLGGDYMKYPPEEERRPKHRGVFDPEKPYKVYTELLNSTFEDIRGKQIILFGAGMMFEDYMKKYGARYRPAFLVDNDENKWGRSRMGFEIRRPEAILKVPEGKRRLIICSYYYKEIISQLEKMGIHDYKVYVQEPEWIIRTENQH